MVESFLGMVSFAMMFVIVMFVVIFGKILWDYLSGTQFQDIKDFWYYALKWIRDKSCKISDKTGKLVKELERRQNEEEREEDK